jgi:hypothetical protein
MRRGGHGRRRVRPLGRIGFLIFEMFLPKFTNGEKFSVEVIKVGRYGELEELDRVRPSCSRPPPPI